MKVVKQPTPFFTKRTPFTAGVLFYFLFFETETIPQRISQFHQNTALSYMRQSKHQVMKNFQNYQVDVFSAFLTSRHYTFCTSKNGDGENHYRGRRTAGKRQCRHKGQNKGTATMPPGAIPLPSINNQVLVFSYTGFTTREIIVGNQPPVINVQLSLSATNLNDVGSDPVTERPKEKSLPARWSPSIPGAQEPIRR